MKNLLTLILLFVVTLSYSQVQTLHGNYVDWDGEVSYTSMDVHITTARIAVVDGNTLYIQNIESKDTLDMSEFYTKVEYTTEYGNSFIVEHNPIGIETVDFHLINGTCIKIREIFYNQTSQHD